jgi:ABC-type branched-subunit amino acid transport system substrate-binding protein
MKRRRTASIALAVSAGFICAACSSSSSSSPATSSSTSATGSSSTSSAPYVVWNVVDVADDPASVGAQAGVNAVNAAGGLNGRKVVLKVCNTNNSANTATTCARTMVADPNTLAAVGNFTELGSSINPILAAGNMASLAADLDTASDFTSPNVITPDVGGAAIDGQQAIMLNVLHDRQGGEVNEDFPANHLLEQTTNQLLACQGVPPVKAGFAAYGTPDFSPEIAAVGKVQALFIIVPSAAITTVAKDARQLGYTYPFIMGGLGSNHAFDSIPNRGTIYRPGYFNTSSQGFKDYENAMGAQANTVNDTNTSAQAYLGMMMLKYAAQKLGSNLNRQNIEALFKKTTDFSYEGIAPAANFTVKDEHLGGSEPNLVVPYVYAQQLTASDQFVTLDGGKPIDIFGSAAPSAKC